MKRILPALPIFTAMLILLPSLVSAATCTHFASPSGGGNGLSQSSPFQIADFWSVAGPGDSLCLLDGTYTDSSSNINPPDNLNGEQGNPITVRALNDGKVLINGGTARYPVYLYYNDWFVIEGIDATGSYEGGAGSVVLISWDADYNVIRRVVAYDVAPNAPNSAIFGIHQNTGNLLEDCAGFGRARKVFSASQYGNSATFRRCFGQWTQNGINFGPEMTFTFGYRNYDMIAENLIGTWKQQGPSTNREYGVFSTDSGYVGAPDTGNRLLGSIAFTEPGDVYNVHPEYGVVFMKDVGEFDIENVAIYAGADDESGNPSRAFGLYDMCEGDVCATINPTATSLTSISQQANYFHPDWSVSDVDHGASMNDVESIWTSTKGAQVCHRYQDGVLTSTPLWPWPMDQRIYDALQDAGYTPFHVTDKIEELFGTIPDECRGTGPPSQACSDQGYYCCPSGNACSNPRTGSGCGTGETCCASQGECTPGTPPPSEKTYTAVKTSSAPAIDGDISEFSSADTITVTNPAGTSGSYRLIWDDTALYIAGEVTDEQLNAVYLDRDGTLWRDDSVELLFDTLHNEGPTRQQDDYKFYTNIINTQSDSKGVDSSWNCSFASASFPSGSSTVNDNSDADTGYTLELAIPWSEWGVPAPLDGETWGFDFSMNDREASGSYTWQAWANLDGDSSLNNPDGWGDLTFSSQVIEERLILEAESATLTSPMSANSDPQASGGSYISTDASNQGSASFTFNVQEAANYRIEAMVMTPETQPSHDSFYVGLDGENPQGDESHTYDTLQTVVFAWDSVSLRGINGNVTDAEHDPMVWKLSPGQQTFTFYGRERDTRLDQVALVKHSHRADQSPWDTCISQPELLAFIDSWYLDSTEYPMGELMEAVGLWKSGTGCQLA